MRIPLVILVLLGGIGLTACQEPNTDASTNSQPSAIKRASSSKEAQSTALANMRTINARLAARGLRIALNSVEFFTIGQGRPSNRLLTINTRWVPNDSRRLAQGIDITYMTATNRGATASGLTALQTEPAIDRAMQTWAADRSLKKTLLVKRAYPAGTDVTVFDEIVDAIFGTGFDDFPAPGNPLSDIVDAGWLPLEFFEDTNLLFGGQPGDGTHIIAFTITFIFVDANGDPTDINGDNRLDTALKEVYYNDFFGDPNAPANLGGRDNPWGIDVDLPGLDVETIALHENGHGLELGHFGPPPSAVMNPVYAGPHQSPSPTDNAALRIIWASWPNP
jgi:hypothetical protein